MTSSAWLRDKADDLCSNAAPVRGAARDALACSRSCDGLALGSPDARVDDLDPRNGRVNMPSRP
ncbi:hypothetical protein [Trinickia sp.]|uniref:hypothetical protein n=1 Tax=Trinickia sp. TaxID=2571163 RepID=UPI003F7F5C13